MEAGGPTSRGKPTAGSQTRRLTSAAIRTKKGILGTTSVLEALGATLVFALMFTTVINVVLRIGFQAPMRGSVEYVALIWMPSISLLGLAVAERRSEHIQVGIVEHLLGRRSRKLSDVIQNGVTILFLVSIGIAGWERAIVRMNLGERGPASGILTWPIRFLVPLGVALYLAAILVREPSRESS